MREQLLPADRAGGNPMKAAAGECSRNKRRWLGTPCRAKHGASCHKLFRMSKVYTAWPNAVEEIQGWKRVPGALHSHCWRLGKLEERLPVFLSCSWLLLQVSMSAAAVSGPHLGFYREKGVLSQQLSHPPPWPTDAHANSLMCSFKD